MVHIPKPLAVTSGEPAGIGPDITLLAWANRRKLQLPYFYIRSDVSLLTERARQLGLKVLVQECDATEANAVFDKALPVVQTGGSVEDTPGLENSVTAATVLSSIEQAVADVNSGVAAAVVTNPINKAALYSHGFEHPGHTEYLGALAEKYWGTRPKPVMLIAGPDLMVVPVTIHIPISKVPTSLTKELILDVVRTTDKDLKTRFGIQHPRLAICGLNPHAGESGTMGTEDREVIAPALAQLQSEGVRVSGPHPADTLFHGDARKTYDCAIGMYHDQVLIPAKTLGFDEAVNVTLGLPFVRTSPDHGTAYSLAGTGQVKIDSFAAALRFAAVLADPSAT
ncbi:4-hydroxythreonine-4-phosphate dehydrogenase [Roseibium sp. TrichSKD4]|uniref:4-hydroxythreonine-4-phosphate dehydrogenase PdxA n=1 Tax=Roseibium sp. TrichSKD4 TaxID=744980 RepID=UPI0001E57180|nr:4-hydroxythreonine-4-phosphate dehydrogenase PdxA [Roseibium sp. TrichSKD4]EFO29629.1 4-hydroxythreonine-4-phosphate dehydrogenase [Roseibium sp. TrichSKD4]